MLYICWNKIDLQWLHIFLWVLHTPYLFFPSLIKFCIESWLAFSSSDAFQVFQPLYWPHLCRTKWIVQYQIHHVDIFHQVNSSEFSSWCYHLYHTDVYCHAETFSYHHLSKCQIISFATTFSSPALFNSPGCRCILQSWTKRLQTSSLFS